MTKIVFFISEDWYFLSHRRALAEACRDAGWDVVVATHVSGQAQAIRDAGFILEPVFIDRGGMNPLRDLRTLAAMVAVLRRHRPDILHCVAMKPVLYGGAAAILTGVPQTVSAMAGLGYLFTDGRGGWLARAVKAALAGVVKRCGSRMIVQNHDDFRQMTGFGVARPEQMALIPGSGVDLAAFPAMPEPAGAPVVFALVARMLADKGIREAAAAARLLRAQGIAFELRLVGGTDPHNPTSLSEAELRGWEAEGLLRWLGRQDDIAAVWREAHVAILPSYREGMPKSLLEAEACARPVITTDVEGCREAIENGVEGLMVPVRDPTALAQAMRRLIEDPALRAQMGAAARRRAERVFDKNAILAAHMTLYRAALAETANRP